MPKKSTDSQKNTKLLSREDPSLLDWFRKPTQPGNVNAVIFSNVRGRRHVSDVPAKDDPPK